MSVMGQERTLAALEITSALPPITDVVPSMSEVGVIGVIFASLLQAAKPKQNIKNSSYPPISRKGELVGIDLDEFSEPR